ncbi:hypothetical protein QJQ45_024475, partial [Haematococcus lacustris]
MATSPASASGNQATILDDDNWPIWGIRTEGLLIEAGLWSVVADGVTPLPTAPAANATQQEQTAYAAELARSRADSALDRKAKAFIQRHVSNLHIFTVKSADSAQDAWETLESQFTESSVARQSQLQQQLSLLRMEPGESVARFYARLQQLLTELEACNCETSESTVVLAILAALPPEYESTVERLRYDQTSADLKVERIKRVLLTKEADLLSKQMQQQLSTSSSSLWSYSSPSDSRGAGSSGGQGGRGRFRLPQQSREQQQQQQQARAQSPDRSSREVSSHAHLTCNYCAKPGHIMSECFTFDRDQRNRMRTLFSNSARPSSPGRRPSPGRSSSPAARASSPSRGRTQTPGRTAAQSPSRGASLFTYSTAAADDDDDDLDDVLMQMVQPKLNFNSDLYSPFCIDSGASQHILKDLQFFYNYTPFAPDKHRPVRLAAEGHRVWAVGSGSVFLSTKRGSWFLSHALYVPDSKQNFISVTAATDEGSSFLFRGDVCQISCNQFGSMLRVNAHKVRNSYILSAVPMPDGPDTDSEQEQGAKLYGVRQSALQPDPRIRLELLTNVAAPSATSATSNSPQVWHQRLCHTSYDALARMQSANMVSGVPVTAAQFRAAASDPAVCVGCVKGKQHKNVAFAGPPPNAAPVTAPLGLIHMDVCGPMHARARDGSLYVATFLDEHTKLSVCVPISSKAQVPDTVRTVIEELETQSGYRCKAIRTDNGTEYVNSRMREYCASKGIVHQHSAPYSPQQNGAAERLNRTIFEKARSIIHSADISLSFWAHAVKFANHVRCLLPVSGQPLTPWEAFYGVKPDLSGLRVFGCRVWLHVPDHQRSKLQAKSVEGLFIGYEPGSKAYRVLVNGRETCSKDIVFDELSVLQPARQQDQPAQPVFLLPLPPSPTPSEPLTPAAPAEGGNSLQQTNSSSSEDSGSSSSISRPGSSAQRPQSRPLEGVGAHQDSSSSDSPPSEHEPSQNISLTARYEPGSHMWHQQQLELISKLPRPGIGRFSLRSMPLARETVGAQPAAAPAAARPAAPAAAPAAARPAAPAAAPAARPATSAAAPAAARPAAPAATPPAAPPAAPAAVRPSASAAAPTAARPAAPVTAVARPAAAARPGLAQPALRVPLIPTSATARQAALAVHPSMPMPPAPDPRPASPEAPAAPVPRRNPSRERHRPERFRDSDLFAMNVSDSPVNDTPTVAEALAGPMADLWIEAMNAELASLHANQTWCLEERPANARVLPTKWVLKVKRDAAGNIEKLKARLVAKGQQLKMEMEIHQLDFETAFLNGKLEPGEVIYVQQPEGFEEGSTNTVCRLQKALYGLRQAPRAWHARLCEELLSMGFKASEADPALFTLQLSTGMVYLLVYVDDCLLCTQQGDTAGLAHVKKQLSSAFKLKDLGEARWFLGMQLTRDRAEGTIKLDQHKFIQELGTANSKSAAHSKPLPMAPAVKLVREGDALDTTLHHYSALVGSLLYLTCCTRPDIAFAVGALARHMSAPTKQHWAAACSVLCYLKGTADQGLLFGGVSGLQGFSDADYAGDKDTARSTTGYIFTLNGGAISWSSRLQPTVAMSTAEAEYMAASSAAKEALWLRKLMRDLQLDASCVHLGCDNQAAIQLLHNPMATSRAKHIDVHHHFVRERISRGEVAFHYCHTSSMLADILTKPLAAVQFNMGKQGCGEEAAVRRRRRLQAHVAALAELKLFRAVPPASQSFFLVLAEPLWYNAQVRMNPAAREAAAEQGWTHVRHVREALHSPQLEGEARWAADLVRACLPEPWQGMVDRLQPPQPEWECLRVGPGVGFVMRRTPLLQPSHWVGPNGRLYPLDPTGQGPLGAFWAEGGAAWEPAAQEQEWRRSRLKGWSKEGPGRLAGEGGGQGGRAGAGCEGVEEVEGEEWLLGPWAHLQLDPQVWGMGTTTLLDFSVKHARVGRPLWSSMASLDRRARREERQRVAPCRSRRGNTQPATQPARGGPSRRRYGIPSSGSSSEEWEARRAGHQQAGSQRAAQLGHGSPHVRRYGLLSPLASLANSLGASCDSPVVESAGPREGRLRVPKRQQPEQAAQPGEEVEQLGPLPLRPPLAIYSREPRVRLRRPGAKLACIEATPAPIPGPPPFARSACPSQPTHPPLHTRSPRGGKPGLAMQRPGVAASFLAVTLNVQGLAQPHKLQALLDWAADSPAQVVFLQECHRAESVWQWAEAHSGAKPAWRGQWFHTPGTGSSQGCLVLVKPSTILQGCTQVQLQAEGAQGRVLRVDGELAGRPVSLVCVYAPAQQAERPAFYAECLPACLPPTADRRLLLMGGDFNCILAPVDRVGIPQGSQHGEAWRDLTHFSELWQTGARLDRWYISEELVQWQMDNAIHGVLPVPTDHRPVEKAAAVARAHLVRQLVRVEREGEAEVQAAQHLGEAAALAGVGAREQGAQQSLLASAVLDQYYGDRSSFYFYHRDQPAHTPTLISSLQLPGQPGQPANLTTPAGVKAACRAFQQHYSAAEPTGVYAAKPVDTAARATLLGSLTSHLTPTQARAAEGPDGIPMLSEEELGRALQGCAHSKAPGLDGLPMEVASYRPITLLNCDVRLVARAVEDRLQMPLDLLVSPSQSAFILGKDISDSVQFHLGLLEYLQQRGSPAWLLLLDLAGAYDNVSWGLLQDTMEAMGFCREGHVRWAQLLHRGATSQVLVNGHLTDSFPLASGLLQGSGASPLYWCIVLQPLVSYLSSLHLAGRISTPTIPSSPLAMHRAALTPALPSKEYADDLTIVVLDRVRDGKVVVEALGLFRAAGGPALSVSKSSALTLLADPSHGLSTWVITDPTAPPSRGISPRLQAHVAALAELKLFRAVPPASQSFFLVLAEPLWYNAQVRMNPAAREAAAEQGWTHVRHVREALHSPQLEGEARWAADLVRACLPEPWQGIVDRLQPPQPEWECLRVGPGVGFVMRRTPLLQPSHWVGPNGRLYPLDPTGQGPLGAFWAEGGAAWEPAAQEQEWRRSRLKGWSKEGPGRLAGEGGGQGGRAGAGGEGVEEVEGEEWLLGPWAHLQLDPQVWGMGTITLLDFSVKHAR